MKIVHFFLILVIRIVIKKKKKRLPKLIGGIAVELSHWVHPVGILKAVIGTVTVEERRHSLQCTEQRSGQLAPHFQVF